MNRLFRALVLTLPAVSLACGADDREVEIASTRPFHEAFERVASIKLEQNDSLPLVIPVQVEVAPDGTIAVPDFSEGHVRLFESSGKHLRTLGRKGQGPGEFLGPMAAHWDDSGRLHVLDVGRMIISVFGRDGAYIRDVSLAAAGYPSDFAPLPDQGYLLLGSPTPSDLLTRIDSTGGVIRSFLPIAQFRPVGTSNARVWERTLMPLLRVAGETAAVTVSAADSVWIVDLSSGTTVSHSIRPRNYVAPRDPEGPVDDAEAFDAWMGGAHRIRGLALDGRQTYVTFSQGPEERMAFTMLVRNDQGRVEAFTGAQLFQAVVGGRMLTAEQTDTSYVIHLWRPRP